MKITKNFFLIFFAFVFSILDTSFFSFLPIIGEVTIISAYVAIIYFSISGQINDFLIFTIAVIFFFSAFSSLPVWLVVLTFLLVPYFIFYIRKKYFPEPSILSSLAFFGSGTFLFALTSIIYSKEWNGKNIFTSFCFVLINSAFGVLLYYVSKNIRKKLTRKDIKF
ncbi:MAG: hypothetical protein M1324_00905 [Patescibacteria group bacterium]|nr:hypothetical protein [Patescibacteria group bacterium]